MMRARPSDAEGFTLVEMLVVMGILALALSVVAFARPHLERLRVETTARGIAAAMRAARDAAMMRSVETVFRVDPLDRAFGEPGDMRSLPADMTMSFVFAETTRRAGTGAIAFYPDGRSSGGSLELAAGLARARIDVDWLTGLARIQP